MAGVTLLGLKRRLKTVTATRKITQAMELVATSKYQKAKVLLENNDRYFKAFQEIADEISSAVTREGAPKSLYFYPPDPDGEDLYIIMNSMKGLCAAYNSQVTKKALEIAQAKPKSLFVATGTRSLTDLKKVITQKQLVIEPLGDLPLYDDLDAIFQHSLGLYREGEIRSVRIIYNRFISALRMEVVNEILLPMPIPVRKPVALPTRYDFEPSAEEMQEQVFMMYLREMLYNLLLKAKTAEHSTRMRAMHSANKNAETLIIDLQKQLNRVRQSAITQEITEIVGGAEALN